MSDLSDKNIDKIFRSGSEGHDFDYNPAAWKEMEQLLDKEDRRRALWWWFGLAGLVILLAGVFLIQNNISKENNELQALIKSQEKILQNPKSFKESSKQGTSLNPDNQSFNKNYHKPENPENSLDTQHSLQTGKSSESKSRPGFSGGKVPPSGRNEFVNPGIEKKALGKLETTASGATLSGSPLFENTAIEDMHLLSLLPLRPLVREIALPQIPLSTPPLEDSLRISASKKTNSVFLPGLVFASEVSAAGDLQLDYLDWKFGLEAQFKFAHKFTASVGVNYIKKNYNAAYIDYDVPEGFWVRDISPSYTSGHCSILEIPLQLGYYPKGNNESGFLAQAGLSSYLMLKERYYYYYVEADPDLLRYWHSSKVAKHWLGILQLSAGYQLKTEDGFFRVSPYAQIPVQGVGIGNIKLYSFGLQFNYNILLKK